MLSKTIMFIHGMFMTSRCWEQWVPYFEAKGYTCLAPNWPGRDASIEALRNAHPDPKLGQLILSDVIDHYVGIIQNLNEAPILIGHSMGGLCVQILLQRGVASAGVAIDPAPPVGVFPTRWSFFKANWPMINPFISKTQPHMMTFEQFQYAFVNDMPETEQRAAYDRYVVPESRGVPRESLGTVAKIAFGEKQRPLLLIAGQNDHIIPASLNKQNYAKYRQSGSVTAFKEFAGRNHFIIGQPNWSEVADYILSWLEEQS